MSDQIPRSSRALDVDLEKPASATTGAVCPACGSTGPHAVFRFARFTRPDVIRAACRDCPVGFELDDAETQPVCDHGHPQVERWSGVDSDECWYGHPVTTGVATCTYPGSGRES